ncbi:5-methylcytosine-specific restriction endonuclease system specificity protein McrC [Bifidobacterium platyrrhinorum]|uniref:5-methylcytosine-specific restriction endonuclease system specificity protein McrC n=1 Tax=Bifidobacterium platyrrhinorum TaxID=2661628 RepID=A0A6L9SP24_9BIFI|nr:5-methylcytosine-specific restriction endonuclease system specificity protein McrC [Bifidobacterium platyrrhinorum]NEG54278.1 5-methylcytosine-specific restriction endonuclease system specificity protein McrC [Bifidobacterium platyrrhinorum]
MIPIRNIYHMLTYYFETLDSDGYHDMAGERFDNTADLFAAIMIRGLLRLAKQGLRNEYRRTTEPLMTVRGRIDMVQSMRPRNAISKRLVCEYDVFCNDTDMNRIIKSATILLTHADIRPDRNRQLHRLLDCFSDVSTVDLRQVDWRFRFDRNNQTYRMLLGICWFIAKGLLPGPGTGAPRLMNFLDDKRMSHLYEKFILSYYQHEYPQATTTSAYIDWDVIADDPWLPVMHSDVCMTYAGRILLLDAKYYSHTMQQRFGKETLHSSNLYQIFTYVKNKASKEHLGNAVSGLLLYAKNDDGIVLGSEYTMGGNLIAARTLDLNLPFPQIVSQLDDIANRYLRLSKSSAH